MSKLRIRYAPRHTTDPCPWVVNRHNRTLARASTPIGAAKAYYSTPVIRAAERRDLP